MPEHHQSPSSSVSSLSGSEVVFSQPALAANRDNDLVIDLDTDDEYASGVFAWPAVESPAAHHMAPLRPSHRALLLTGSGDAPAPRVIRPSSGASTSTPSTTTERRLHALTIAINRGAEQAADPSTSLARHIAARESARTSSSPLSQQDFPTARLLSRTTVSVAEPEPASDLRRLATTREAERQLQYRDWHRLNLLDPPAATAASDGASVSPGRMTPQLAYARRRSSAATTRPLASSLDHNEGQEDDIDVLSMDITQRLRRRMAALDALDPVTDSQLERDRERDHDPSAPLPSVSSSIRSIDRRLGRFRSWLGRNTQWEDGRDDPNGENVYNEHGHLATPASRSRYWNALSNAATDDLLALAVEMLALLTRIQSSAAERSTRPAPSHPPGLPSTTQEPTPTPPKSIPFPDPLPSPLGTMLLPTPRQRFRAAFRAS
ncbi:2OG-Fe(II) oxygenase family protein [Ceratobasidium sp. AG-Ba]|nr:2OG-Fe(II) oxygenase family protein [Ceratobasidium sp. AG-Ba]